MISSSAVTTAARRSNAVPATNHPIAVRVDWPTSLSTSSFYELMIENLTKSGRTWEEPNNIDHEAFAAAFGSGGRYAGDTFTSPSTLA